MDLSKIWIVQGAAARKTEDEYGTQQALEYLVGDKFFNFLEAADGVCYRLCYGNDPWQKFHDRSTSVAQTVAHFTPATALKTLGK
jgi:hypothetical protein